MKLQKYPVLMLLMVMLLAACAPAALSANTPATLPPSPTATSPAAAPVATAPASLPTSTAPAAQPKSPLPPAVSKAIDTLAQQLGVPANTIKLVKAEHVDWPDGCLGVQKPGVMCTQIVTPGYRVILEAGGKQYEFHTNETGETVAQASAGIPQTSGKALVWEQTEGNVCSRAEIGPQSVAFGPCGGTLTEAQLSSGRVAEMAYLLATYQTFSGGTTAGTVQFNGQGQREPTGAEKRSVAEWAKLVDMEAQSGRSGAAWGLALTWHREGGIAGFCNDLSVYLTGWAVSSSCKPNQPAAYKTYRLTPDELVQLYGWVDQFTTFDYEHKDAATTDAMLIRMELMGHDSAQATPGQQDQVAAFAAQIYGEASR